MEKGVTANIRTSESRQDQHRRADADHGVSDLGQHRGRAVGLRTSGRLISWGWGRTADAYAHAEHSAFQPGMTALIVNVTFSVLVCGLLAAIVVLVLWLDHGEDDSGGGGGDGDDDWRRRRTPPSWP